jgi:hypothetical protein
MFGVSGSFVEYAAYLHGYQHGGAGRWLDDFRLWLAHGLDLETNLGWPSYLLRLTFPDRSGSWDLRAERTAAEEAAACSALFDWLLKFDAAFPEELDRRPVIVGAGHFEVLARLAGEFGELSDRSLAKAGTTRDDAQRLRDAVRSAAASSVVLRSSAFGSEVVVDRGQLRFPPGRLELFRALISEVVQYHGERELFYRTGFDGQQVQAAVAVLTAETGTPG